MVYFIESAGLIKIGVANDVTARLRSLQCGSAMPLDLVLVLEGGRPLERELHRRFAAYRRHGEWFALPPDWRDKLFAMSCVPSPDDPPHVAISRVASPPVVKSTPPANSEKPQRTLKFRPRRPRGAQ